MDPHVLGPVGAHASDRRTRRAEPGDELGGRRHGGGIDAMGAGQGDDVGAMGSTEEALEPIRRELGRLRQEREDPAAIVVDNNDP